MKGCAVRSRRERSVGDGDPTPAAKPPVARRIVIVVGSLARGGAERVATTLANAWAEQGREVWLVATYLGCRTADYPLHPHVQAVFLGDLLGRRKVPSWLVSPWKVLALRKVIRAIRPDVVVSFLTNVNVLTVFALTALPIPLVVSERTDPAGDRDLHPMLRLARARCYRRSDAVVVQTAVAAQRWGARLPGVRRIQVIHNPLPRELAAWPTRAHQPALGGRVIAIGRLSREKGFATLIEAFGKALSNVPAWTLEIWGEGPLRPELASLIERLRLQDRVRLCGATAEPWAALARAQLFILSSEYEGFPNAMLEAMAVGLPCVALDCPSGPRELADGGAAAIMVPPGDLGRLVAVLRDLVADPDARRRLGERAAVSVREKFAEPLVLGDWDGLIAQLLSKTIPGPAGAARIDAVCGDFRR